MKKLLQQSFLSALVISLTACGGGSSHSKIVSTASSVTTSSAVVTSSSSSSSVATTTYNVSVDVPTSFATQAAVTPLPRKITQFFIASAYADEVSALTAANFAVVIVDLAGKVLERVALTDSDISKNSDGSWALTVPGNPRLDCVIVADVTKPIELPVDGNINQEGFVFAPTTAETVDIDVGSTAAFKNFIEELGGSGSFESLNIDPTDTQQIKAVENLVNTIQTVVADQPLTNYGNVAEALAAIKSTVSDTVKQEVQNVKSPAVGNAVSLIRDEGGLFWFEGSDFSEIAYGGIAGTDEEVGYYYDGAAFVKDTKETSGQQLVLSSAGWVATSDKFKVASFNDDGTVIIQDTSADGAKQKVAVTQVFDLAGRNVSEYLSANYTTKLLGKMANPATTFASGAKGYRVQTSAPEKSYAIHYQPANGDGVCPWNSSLAVANYGGNCNLIMTQGAEQGGASAPAAISALFSQDVAPGVTGFVAVSLPSKATSGMLMVQLLDDAAKTERFYLQSWASGTVELIGTGAWTELTLPVTEDSRVIHIQIPKEVAMAAAKGGTDGGTKSSSSAGGNSVSSDDGKSTNSEGSLSARSESAKSFSSEGANSFSSQGVMSANSAHSENAKSASVESATSATSEGVKSVNSESSKAASSAPKTASSAPKTGNGEGGKAGSKMEDSLDYYIVRQAGFLRQLNVVEAGVDSEDAGAVFNGTAKADILAALDYTRPPTLLPTAAITVDGIDTDWANVTPYLLDPVGDQRGGIGRDLTQVSIAKSGENLALLMKISGDFANRESANYEVAIHFFDNSNCLGHSNGFMVVNNFTPVGGENIHTLNGYFDDGLYGSEGPTTMVASAGQVLETSFNFQYLPVARGDYISLTSVIHTFTGSIVVNHDSNDQQKTCLKIR